MSCDRAAPRAARWPACARRFTAIACHASRRSARTDTAIRRGEARSVESDGTRLLGGSKPGWPWTWSEPHRQARGQPAEPTRSERFLASPSLPVIRQATRSTGGPRAPDHCRHWQLLGDATAEESRAQSAFPASGAGQGQPGFLPHARECRSFPLTGRRGSRLPCRSTFSSPPSRHLYPESPHHPRPWRTSSCPSHDSARRRPAQGVRTGCCGRR